MRHLMLRAQGVRDERPQDQAQPARLFMVCQLRRDEGLLLSIPEVEPMSAQLTQDLHELRKWLNEEPNRPLDRIALARVLAAHEAAPQQANDPLIAHALIQIEAAKLVIDTRMKQLREQTA